MKKSRSYYFNYAKKLLSMTLLDCIAHLNAITKQNGEEERDAIVSQFSKVLAATRGAK